MQFKKEIEIKQHYKTMPNTKIKQTKPNIEKAESSVDITTRSKGVTFWVYFQKPKELLLKKN